MGLFSNQSQSTQTQSQNQTTAPWSAQQPYLLDAFKKAQSNYNTGASSLYSGQQIAGFTPEQMSVFKSLYDYGTNNNIPGLSASVGSNLANTGSQGLTAAMDRLLAFKPQGSTQSNIDAAGSYANNPYISGQVDAAMRDANRYVNEQQLPALERTAAMTGNVNASTTGQGGIAEGIIRRGLAEKAADVSANMRGSAYTQGLNLAEQGRQSDTSAVLDALKATGSLGATSAASGVDALGNSIRQQGTLYDLAGTGAQGYQDANQNIIDNAKAMSEYGADRLNTLLSQYFNTVGSQNWGSQQTGTQTTNTQQTQNKSLGDTIAGILGGVGGLFKK